MQEKRKTRGIRSKRNVGKMKERGIEQEISRMLTRAGRRRRKEKSRMKGKEREEKRERREKKYTWRERETKRKRDEKRVLLFRRVSV